MCLWLIIWRWRRTGARELVFFCFARNNAYAAATYLYCVDIEPHILLMIHSYFHFLHNQCSRRACICYHFVRNTNVHVAHHIYQPLFPNYMCLLT